MPVALEKAYRRASEAVKGAFPDPGEPLPVPTVNPDSPDLTDLFAWGEAVAKHGRLKMKDSLAILRAVRKDAENRR